jgi:flagellar capping protein FliD
LSLGSISTITQSTFDGGSAVTNLITTFVDKYNKLAVALNDTQKRTLLGANVSYSVAKVPGKNIFVLDAGSADASISIQDN